MQAQTALENYGGRGLNEFNIALGRYVVMPDHIHLFVRGGPTFFDYILRSDESYGEKWEYVRRNPVRAGLVARTEDWPYQGELALIDRA